MALDELLEPSAFVGSVIDENRAAVILVDGQTHRIHATKRRILTAQIQELGMSKNSGLALDMARPLKWNMLVGTHAHPARNGQVDALEVEVIPRIAEPPKDFTSPVLQ